MKIKLNMTHVLFGIYCLLLIWIILFKLAFTYTEIKCLVGNRSVNFIPFYYQDDVAFHGREVILNFIIFIPLGLYLKMLDISSVKSILYGLLFSFLLELGQFALRMGASDITDIITNTLGTAVGVCSYLLISKLFGNKRKIDRIINGMAIIAILLFLSLALLLFLAN